MIEKAFTALIKSIFIIDVFFPTSDIIFYEVRTQNQEHAKVIMLHRKYLLFFYKPVLLGHDLSNSHLLDLISYAHTHIAIIRVYWSTC